jgi:hypothetical protein
MVAVTRGTSQLGYHALYRALARLQGEYQVGKSCSILRIGKEGTKEEMVLGAPQDNQMVRKHFDTSDVLEKNAYLVRRVAQVHANKRVHRFYRTDGRIHRAQEYFFEALLRLRHAQLGDTLGVWLIRCGTHTSRRPATKHAKEEKQYDPTHGSTDHRMAPFYRVSEGIETSLHSQKTHATL